jgi:predicted RNA polymerase sigma factor
VLAEIEQGPIVEVNRAVPIGMADGAAAGLAAVDALAKEPALKSYHLSPAVRRDLLAKLGRAMGAWAEFQRAAGLAMNSRALLTLRAAAL